MMVLAIGRADAADFVSAFFRVWVLLLFAYIILSMAFAFGARMPYSRTFSAVFTFLQEVAEVVLRPLRRVLPSFGPLDLSPMVATFGLLIVGGILSSIVRG